MDFESHGELDSTLLLFVQGGLLTASEVMGCPTAGAIPYIFPHMLSLTHLGNLQSQELQRTFQGASPHLPLYFHT